MLNVLGEVSDIIRRNCVLCRKASGSACAKNGFVNKDEFEIAEGWELMSNFESCSGKLRSFCAKYAPPICTFIAVC